MGQCWGNMLSQLYSDPWLLVQCVRVLCRVSWDKPQGPPQPYLPRRSASTSHRWDMGSGCTAHWGSSTPWGPTSPASQRPSCHGPAAPVPLHWSQQHPGSLQSPGRHLGKNASGRGHPERGPFQASDPGSSLGARGRCCLHCQPTGGRKCPSPPPEQSATRGHSRATGRKDFHRSRLGSGIPAGALRWPAVRKTQMTISKTRKCLGKPFLRSC